MFGCCKLRQVQYMEPDGTIDWEFLNTVRKDFFELALKSDSQFEPNELREPFTPDKPPCMCCCHVKGSRVMC